MTETIMVLQMADSYMKAIIAKSIKRRKDRGDKLAKVTVGFNGATDLFEVILGDGVTASAVATGRTLEECWERFVEFEDMREAQAHVS